MTAIKPKEYRIIERTRQNGQKDFLVQKNVGVGEMASWIMTNRVACSSLDSARTELKRLQGEEIIDERIAE